MLCSVKLFMKHILKHRVLYINKVLIFLIFFIFFFGFFFFNHVTGFNDLNIEHS